MAVRFFGQYLLEHRVIDSRQLLEAVAYQEKVNLKFGDTAISMGLLTNDQLAQCLKLQASKNFKTGEAAVSLGFLNPGQIEQVLLAQRNSHVMIGEALIATGAVNRATLDKHLAAYKAEQAKYQMGEGVPPGLDPSGVGASAVDLAMKFTSRIAQIQLKIVDCRNGSPPSISGVSYGSRLGFQGDVRGELAMRAGDKTAALVASAMVGERIPPESAAMITDAMSELINVIGGNWTAALARAGKSVEIGAPKRGDSGPIGQGQHQLVAELASPEHTLWFSVVTHR
jgi:CheY-specific phosphatase CheX